MTMQPGNLQPVKPVSRIGGGMLTPGLGCWFNFYHSSDFSELPMKLLRLKGYLRVLAWLMELGSRREGRGS